MRTSIWARWVARYGAPRAFLTVQARRGQPLARFLLGRAGGDEMYRLVEDIRTQGRLVQRPFVWVSADHEICRTVLRDGAFGATNLVNAPLPQPIPALLARSDPGLPNPVERPAMVMTNPPDHTRYRRLFAQSFTPRAIDRLNTRVEEITAQLLDDLERKSQPDLVADFATELPVAVIAEILGLPTDARPQVREWGYSLAPLLDFGTNWKTFRHAIEHLREVDRYAAEFIERARAADSGDDPFGRVAAGGELTHREFAANAALLVGAGFETTVNLIGNGIVLLLKHPQQLALLRDDPGLWPAAIEEILRFESPVQMLVRTARRDVEIAGEHIRTGAMLVLLMGGANRDPGVFTDPGRFDITRPNAREHLAFGSGIHGCLGAALARIEGVIALRTLFERFPGLSLREQPEPLELVTLHGFKSLPAQLRTRPTGHISRTQQ
ncbi:cytochrome P450 [Mycobacterium montefiorense]|uniref:Cytochrome P450 n=1 Tax=Mycobacterium montefiorense TaxID=154654 RepID=A0AA37PQM3_9MYCO|nr:cytochrome P450 [Mycobacterium montefiorense]GBG36574.1 putative cytochrome P450 [Mycobacterium montefiorense]GKU36923.1 putative cytochrome P450 [Mycobacterium montefiorense]GKU43171.1 putative cytochrome P450 [Mycobacterium montefiorense]GKU48518.1 putative cytochrome P450 [Mycobacterium montefiorense]GKU50548.1 putative cytochrome P450 [Mycobacterium montefiorense]